MQKRIDSNQKADGLLGMMLRIVSAGLLCFLPVLATAQLKAPAGPPFKTAADTNSFAVQFGEKRQLHSEVLREDRPYWVYLPDSYRPSDYAPKRYPVLYLLDGDSHFQWACGVVRFMSVGWNLNIQIPELIIVAIPNTSTNRDRDLTPARFAAASAGTNTASTVRGGGETFRRFLQEELIPHIETNYRTAPFKILAGHSLGGLFTVDSFLHRPPLFQAYLAMDPYLDWEDGATLRKAQERLPKTGELREPIYLSMAKHRPAKEGGVDPGNQACRKFAELLNTHKSAQCRVKLQYFEEEDHSSVPLVSLYHGLLFLFDGYKPSLEVVFNPASLKEHFAKVSDRFGFDILPPQQLVDSSGHYMLYAEHNPEKAMESFRLNAANYPDSPASCFALGEACAARGEKDLAIQHFKKVLQFRPTHEGARNWLKKLEQP